MHQRGLPMRNFRGQSILEYTIIVGIVTVVLYYMGTGIKRGVQSLVKVTADQVGSQQNSDQDFNDYSQGYLVSSGSQTAENNNKQVTVSGYILPGSNPDNSTSVYVANTNFNEETYTMTNTITNGGFAPSS